MFGRMLTVFVAGDVVTRGRIQKVYHHLYRTIFDDDKPEAKRQSTAKREPSEYSVISWLGAF